MPWLRRLVIAVALVVAALVSPGTVAAQDADPSAVLLDEVGSGLERDGPDLGAGSLKTRRFVGAGASLDLQAIVIEDGFDVAQLFSGFARPVEGLEPFPEPSLPLATWLVGPGERPGDVPGAMLVFASADAIFVAVLQVDETSAVDPVPFLLGVAQRQIDRAGGPPAPARGDGPSADPALERLFPDRAGGLELVGTYDLGAEPAGDVQVGSEVQQYVEHATATAVRIWSSGDGRVLAAMSITEYPLELFAAASLGVAGRTSTTTVIDEPAIESVPGAVAIAAVGGSVEQIGSAVRRGPYSVTVLVGFGADVPRDAVVGLVASMTADAVAALPSGDGSSYRFPGTRSRVTGVALSVALVTLAIAGAVGVGRARAHRLRRASRSWAAPETAVPEPATERSHADVSELDDDAARLRRRARVVLGGQLLFVNIGVAALSGDFAWTGVIVAAVALVAGVVFTGWWSRRERALLGPVAPRVERILPRPGGALLGLLALAVLGLGAGFGLKGLRYLVLAPTLAQLRWADLFDLTPRSVGTLFAVGGALVCVLGASLFRLARAWSRADSRRLLRRDQRPPVLYLRAFEDDAVPLATIVSARRPMLELFSLRGADPFEEAIAAELDTYGPVIAVGRPGRSLASLGAAREHLPDETWQEQVAERMEHACTIVVAIGRSDGLHWEIARIVQAGHLGKSVFVFPPLGETVLGARWSFVAEAIRSAGAPLLELPVPHHDIHTVRVAADGRPLVTTASRRDEASYRTAIDRALMPDLRPLPVEDAPSAEDEFGHRPQGVG